MTELRLVPAAIGLWLVVFTTIATTSWGWGLAVVIGATVVAAWFDCGQAVVLCGLLLFALLVAAMTVAQVGSWEWPNELYAVAHSVGQDSAAGWMQHYSVSGYPTTVPVFFETHQPIPVGTTVRLAGKAVDTAGLGVNRQLFFAEQVTVVRPPDVLHRWSESIRLSFAQVVDRLCVGDAKALIPAMVLGDTSFQNAETKQVFISSGLAHLSAVSGANVAIVTTTAMVIFGRFSPVVRVGAALIILAVYVLVVGFEPSVLRAAVTGVIGIIAMLSATVRSPINALAVSVIGLVLYDVSLATNFGFALSVAATVGIIIAAPGLYWFLSVAKMPAVLAQALSIALAAHLITAPVVAAMNNQLSVIGVFANIAVAPVVAPITVLGLMAVILSLVSANAAGLIVTIIEPLAWWIGVVARWSSSLPGASYTLETDLAPLWAILIALWVVYFLHAQKLRLLLGLTCVALVGPSVDQCAVPPPRVIDPATLKVAELASDRELPSRDFSGVQLIVINQPPPAPTRWNKSPPRPQITTSGIPIAYRLPDGRLNITLYDNGVIKIKDQSTVK